ncbi:MAG: hypothetical protein QOG63_2637 [Thermoleophilaceae bacterium]|nr:hypothetical protein [Thermoleophilaceae bacterium]
MSFKESFNRALVRTTGYQLQRPMTKRKPARKTKPPERLVEQPTFILSTVRSGSTLLRVLLDSHSQIYSPHEIHLREMRVRVREGYPRKSLREMGLDPDRLRYLLWDRVLHRELQRSGKKLIVNKTPNDVFIVDKIATCWPDARFIFLLRHPAAIARSRAEARKQKDRPEQNANRVLRYADALERARQSYPGLTVRYEDLAADPATVTKEICAFLGVPWEESMLDYGQFQHGRFKPGLGDWTENIRTGQVQPPKPLPEPDETPAQLVDVAKAWGYIPATYERAPKPPVETA